ncbi:DUF7161 family protein [Gordonia rubripertincta]|uniref:Uncharacterized protein n=1 Tax=Gordonia rubripertincta TaxID=36822 RepID=A0ABT4MYF5_GORRU|nr:hypothetical protein [Gordonia rubripertincta]MCZ4550732.1 hypothetical protein [Gordonia rubripertincta]
MRAFDTFVTISLFVLLISAVLFSVYLGGMSTMLSDSGAPGIAVGGVFLAIFGIPVTAVTVYVAAVLLAWQADGLTFYYPIVAFGVMVVAAALVMVVSVGLIAMGQWIHERNASTAPAEASTATAREPKVLTYDRTHYFQEKNRDAELGVERHTGRRYLAVTMPQRGQEFREYFGLDKQTYEAFVAEPQDAIFLADRCRTGTYVTDRMPWAGSPVPEPVHAGQTGLARKRAILLTDVPTDVAGVVADLPRGIPYVVIVDDGVDPAGNVGVHAHSGDPRILIAAHQLGLG